MSYKNALSNKSHSLIKASGRIEKDTTYPQVEDNYFYKIGKHCSSRLSIRNISYLRIVMFKALSYEVYSMY